MVALSGILVAVAVRSEAAEGGSGVCSAWTAFRGNVSHALQICGPIVTMARNGPSVEELR